MEPYRTPAVVPRTHLESAIDNVRVADVLLHAHLDQQQELGMAVWTPGVARASLHDDAYGSLTQSYRGFWEQADAAGQHLLDARVDVQAFWVLSNGRRPDYVGCEDSGDSIAIDVGETRRMQQALHELKTRLPAAIWQPAPVDPQAASYLSKVQGRDFAVKGVLYAAGVIGFIILLLIKFARFCS
jgi:hypothetical protein